MSKRRKKQTRTEAAPAVAALLQRGALLFDEGSLRAFLELELAPILADKVPGIRSWPNAAPCAWSRAPSRVRCARTSSRRAGLRIELLHSGMRADAA